MNEAFTEDDPPTGKKKPHQKKKQKKTTIHGFDGELLNTLYFSKSFHF